MAIKILAFVNKYCTYKMHLFLFSIILPSPATKSPLLKRLFYPKNASESIPERHMID